MIKKIFLQNYSASNPTNNIVYNKSIPNCFTAKANNKKITAVNITQETKVRMKPHLGNKYGKSKNMGNVGNTYQNV